MHRNDRKLLRELGVVIVVKVALLAVLWGAFVYGHRVEVNADHMARQAGVAAFGGHDNPEGNDDGRGATR